MSQTETEIALEEFREAGAAIKKVPRLYLSKRMSGFNAAVYAGWIERWARHCAQNYPVITRAWGARLLINSAKKIPAAIVGIGPSLDDSIEDLRMMKGRGLIIATDAAVRPLLRHDIVPDLVINYDAKTEQRTMWETIEDRTAGIPLIANSCTAPETIAAWKGPIMFFNMAQNDDEFATNILPCIYPHLGALPNLGTVGNGAIFLAHDMGCDPIFMVGMDLCYQQTKRQSIIETHIPSWRYRAKDYRWAQADPASGEPAQWMETENKTLYDNDQRMAETFDEEIKGKTYKVDEPLKFYRNSIVNNVGGAGIPVINCSGGVLTDMVQSLPLKEAIKKKCLRHVGIGETIVKHLSKILPDCKAGLDFDGRYWSDNPTRGEAHV